MERKTVAKRRAKKPAGNGANLGFEQTLWFAADKLRNNLVAAESRKLEKAIRSNLEGLGYGG